MSRPHWKGMTLRERVWLQLSPPTESGCIEWLGLVSSDGYGKIRVGIKRERAHRVVYEMLIGPIPRARDIHVDHLCRNRKCVNVEHLEVVSEKVNILRGTSPTALNARKTHCPRGHEYTGENLIVGRAGWRACRACKAAASSLSHRLHLAERKAKQAAYRAKRRVAA